MITTIKHIFFDLDHTLWDFDKNSEKAFETVLQNYFPVIDLESFMSFYNPINQACWVLYQNDIITHQELRYRRLKETFDKLNIEINEAEIEKISEDYIEFLPQSNHLFEGCVDVLEYLNLNYKLHIITNGFADVQFKKLSNSGINHFFDTVTNSEKAGAKKPNPIIFDYALKVANASKSESIMIGDSLDADVKGARDFGMDAIYFNTNFDSVPEEIKQITNLVELKKIF